VWGQVYLSYMCCHYYNMRLTVEVDLLFGDEAISLKQAQELAKKIQKEVLTIKDVHHADIMVNLTLQSANKERVRLFSLRPLLAQGCAQRPFADRACAVVRVRVRRNGTTGSSSSG